MRQIAKLFLRSSCPCSCCSYFPLGKTPKVLHLEVRPLRPRAWWSFFWVFFRASNKKSFFFSGPAFTTPPPLSGPSTKKRTFYSIIYHIYKFHTNSHSFQNVVRCDARQIQCVVHDTYIGWLNFCGFPKGKRVSLDEMRNQICNCC